MRREKVKVLLNSGAPVIVSLAPSFAANYDGVGIDSMRVALKKLGFAGVEETALGATMVKREYERMLKEEQRDILISSCCHSINLLIQKYYPEALRISGGREVSHAGPLLGYQAPYASRQRRFSSAPAWPKRTRPSITRVLWTRS